MEAVVLVLGSIVAVAVGSLLAYALAAPGGRRVRKGEGAGKTRYELDNEAVWNPWAFVTFAVVIGGIILVVVLLGR